MRRLSFMITLLASALFLLPITLAQGQDQTVQPLPQDQTVQPLPQDQTVQPLPPQEDISQRQEQGQNQSVQPVPIQDVVSVAIADHYFDVADIAIEPGTTVLWVNEGKVPHTVTADDGSFDSGELNPGDSYIVTFLGSGRLSYHCQLHSEMVGSVTVGGESRGGEAPPTGPQYSDKPAYEDLEHAIVPTGPQPTRPQYSDKPTYEDPGHAIAPTEPRYSNRPTYEDPGHAIVPTGPQYSDKPTYEDPGHAIV